MKYYFRMPGESKFYGPSDIDEIYRQVGSGAIGPNAEALEAAGQTFGQLKRAGAWIPVSTLFEAFPAGSRPITPTTHCFVLTNSERRGPFLIKQVEAMWQSGAITADARLEWEGAEAVPISMALQRVSHRASSEINSPIWKFILTPLGVVAGLLVSFLFRPQLFGHGPSLGEWLTAGLQSQYASTILVCGAIGGVIGFVAGQLVDAARSNS